tara:strand:+ start:4963 stop:5142 length:180 start_codon:yes stop_codon:yes gene_type:complete
MKVKLITPRAGIGFSQNRGDIIEVDNDEAKRMIEKGQCEPVKSTKRQTAKPADIETPEG